MRRRFIPRQAARFADVNWNNPDGSLDTVNPSIGEHAAFGARPPDSEQVVLIRIDGDMSATLRGTDTPLDSSVDYVEYDPTEHIFALIFDDGRMQELGIEFDIKIKDNLKHGSEVTLALMENKAIASSQKVVFLIRKN